MMRSMRAIYKPVFVIVATTFIGWLAYGQVTDILGGGRDVVLKVNGQVVRATQFQAALQSAIEDSRRRGAGRLSREDEQQLQDQVTDQLIQRILLEREYRRLGIQVSDDEIRQMARSEEHTSELQSRLHLVCRLLLEKKKKTYDRANKRCSKTSRCSDGSS